MRIKDIEASVATLGSGNVLEKPVIVAYGLMNAGKSFLMNMLTRHIEEECFRTNDIRETVANARHETADCIYIDTPGLDATSEDDEHAHRGAQQGDVVLFVHQPQGELDTNELDFLHRLSVTFGPAAASNIVVVLSKIEKEPDEKIAAVEQRIAMQCQQALGFSPRIFKVSGKRYRDGMLKQQDALVARSGIAALDACLQATVADVHMVRERKRTAQIVVLLEHVTQRRRAAQEQHALVCAAITSSFSAFSEQTSVLRRFLAERGAAYRNI